ncbi:hypothetical protein FLP10_04665 [Agromyces intestinalis]|uniref:NTP pyrophosphohydrolase n=1 Tax=Agromyces intestinalis TaxID=2592652 RepID=A0A5C1YCH5_9MICO|nr:hypothetical protein [Agromyces intestinalis]QEO13793.1 hypothetical protein FLP10_04665 [Agromyces intestinalis]
MGVASSAVPVCVVVDVANVMGSRPDGWWRDRAGAATRLIAGMPALVGRVVDGPDAAAGPARIDRVIAVVEGAARSATAPEGIEVVRAPADGDGSIVAVVDELTRAGGASRVLVVTADRGLRARLADGVVVAGPNWLNALLGR